MSGKAGRRRADALHRNPVRLAMLAAQPANGAWLLHLRIAEREAAQALAEGTATLAHAKLIRLMIVTAGRLAAAGVGPELLPLAQRCDDLVLNFDDAGVYCLADPSAADDLAELVDLADQQRGLTDRLTYERALAGRL